MNPGQAPNVSLRELAGILAQTATLHPATETPMPHDWPDSAWERFVQLALHHRVAPLLAYRAQRGLQPSWPADIMRRFQKALHASRLRHAAGCRALALIDAAFTRAGVEYVPLKGPSLADVAYPDTGLRPFDDLDLLVAPHHVTAAHAALTSLGYHRLPGALPDWLMRQYHFHSQWLHASTRQCVEIHWRLSDKHGHKDTSSGATMVREIRDNPAAMAIYLAIHIAKHGFTNHLWFVHKIDPLLALHPWSDIRLLWLLDFQGYCAMNNLDSDTLTDTARRWDSLQDLHFVQYLVEPDTENAGANPAGLPRYSPKASLLRRMDRDFNHSAIPAPQPWWLRANRRTGFRPVRLLDIFERKTPCRPTL